MRIYKTKQGFFLEKDSQYFLLKNSNWDELINDDQLVEKMNEVVASGSPVTIDVMAADVQAPIGSQEVWACGVTYLRSKIGRQEESKETGGGDFYARVYEAERPEVFFKSSAFRVVGPNEEVRIRKDSAWDVPEPELTLVATSSGKIVGYTIGNDMSSRSIEGENPLYLPQAKTYDGSAAIGPCIFLAEQSLDTNTLIRLEINRNSQNVFKGEIAINQMKRSPEELVSFVFRECSFPVGCFIMTGTGIVPGNDFTLKKGDQIKISIDAIGELVNVVG
jgi:2-dehydro-3-deoxy-D-arabinonate dehydratase